MARFKAIGVLISAVSCAQLGHLFRDQLNNRRVDASKSGGKCRATSDNPLLRRSAGLHSLTPQTQISAPPQRDTEAYPLAALQPSPATATAESLCNP